MFRLWGYLGIQILFFCIVLEEFDFKKNSLYWPGDFAFEEKVLCTGDFDFEDKILCTGDFDFYEEISYTGDFEFDGKIPCTGSFDFKIKFSVFRTLFFTRNLLYWGL